MALLERFLASPRLLFEPCDNSSPPPGPGPSTPPRCDHPAAVRALLAAPLPMQVVVSYLAAADIAALSAVCRATHHRLAATPLWLHHLGAALFPPVTKAGVLDPCCSMGLVLPTATAGQSPLPTHAITYAPAALESFAVGFRRNVTHHRLTPPAAAHFALRLRQAVEFASSVTPMLESRAPVPAAFFDESKSCRDRRRAVRIGMRLDAKDTVSKWYNATVLATRGTREGPELMVQYEGWGMRWNEFVAANSDRLAPLGTRTTEQGEWRFEVRPFWFLLHPDLVKGLKIRFGVDSQLSPESTALFQSLLAGALPVADRPAGHGPSPPCPLDELSTSGAAATTATTATASLPIDADGAFPPSHLSFRVLSRSDNAESTTVYYRSVMPRRQRSLASAEPGDPEPPVQPSSGLFAATATADNQWVAVQSSNARIGGRAYHFRVLIHGSGVVLAQRFGADGDFPCHSHNVGNW